MSRIALEDIGDYTIQNRVYIMAMMLANLFVVLLSLYCIFGLVFSFLFAFYGVKKIDPNAKEATIGFRLLIVPGALSLWPLLAMRWLKGQTEPPAEMNAHDGAALATDIGANN